MQMLIEVYIVKISFKHLNIQLYKVFWPLKYLSSITLMTTSETDGSFKSSKLVQIPYVNDNSKEKRINLVFYAALKLISQTLVIGIKAAVHSSSKSCRPSFFTSTKHLTRWIFQKIPEYF